MILLDYSQVAIGNLHQQIKKSEESIVDPPLLRHMILNSIRKNNRMFRDKFGQLVICVDDHTHWRKVHFAEYKANRHKDREESGIDWDMVFKVMDDFCEDLKKYFPYRVIRVPMAEADDVIGILTKTFSSQEPILIISSDKDFIQLVNYNVTLYRPLQDEMIIFNPTDPTATPPNDNAEPCSDLLSDLGVG